jgi:hypothetical protein
MNLGRRVVPAVPERVVDGPFQLRAEPEVAERSAGAEVPADRAGVEGVDRVRAELRLDVAADLVQVDAEGGQQRRGSKRGPSPRPEPTTSQTASRVRWVVRPCSTSSRAVSGASGRVRLISRCSRPT